MLSCMNIKLFFLNKLYVPSNKMSFFIRKIEDYLTKETKQKGNPKNQKLIESIDEIRLAVLESFWRDDKQLIPKDDVSVECEVWLRIEEKFPKRPKEEDATVNINKQFEDFFKVCDKLNNIENKNLKKQSLIEYKKDQVISFPERTVVLIKANKNQLMELIKSSDQIAEFRRAKETARFWLEQENKDQSDWTKDLQNRLVVDKKSKVSVLPFGYGG